MKHKYRCPRFGTTTTDVKLCAKRRAAKMRVMDGMFYKKLFSYPVCVECDKWLEKVK